MNNQITQQQNQPRKTAMQLLEMPGFKEQLKSALPSFLTPDRMIRMALTELRLNPELQKCDPASFIGAIIRCAQIGL